MERSTGYIFAGCATALAIPMGIFMLLIVMTLMIDTSDTKPTPSSYTTTQNTPSRGADSESRIHQRQDQTEQEEQEIETRPPVAEYEILEEEDISYSVIVRKNYRIVSPTMQADQVRVTAQEIIDQITQEDTDIDAISLLFYSDPSVIYGPYDVAMVEWVPNGEWTDITAEIARKNDRSSYELNIEHGEGLNH